MAKVQVVMSDICRKLHNWANNLRRHAFPIREDRIPLNGIYIVFEKDEPGHGVDRIVRIGTHTGQNQLRSRLRQHFILLNKDRSIFRKNIGRALIAKSNSRLASQWETDLTTAEARRKYSATFDMQWQAGVERQVSHHIQSRLTLAAVEIADRAERLRLEALLISTVSLCQDCVPSKQWLGRSSTKPRITESGLWQQQQLYKTPLSIDDLSTLEAASKKHMIV